MSCRVTIAACVFSLQIRVSGGQGCPTRSERASASPRPVLGDGGRRTWWRLRVAAYGEGTSRKEGAGKAARGFCGASCGIQRRLRRTRTTFFPVSGARRVYPTRATASVTDSSSVGLAWRGNVAWCQRVRSWRRTRPCSHRFSVISTRWGVSRRGSVQVETHRRFCTSRHGRVW